VHLALVIVAAVLALVVAAFVVVMIRGGAAIREFEREVAAIAAAAGYVPFGSTEGPWLTFRSASSYLRVVQGGHGTYVDALLAAREGAPRADLDWVDDDLLRQVLFGEPGDPTGENRVWWDRQAFLAFLRERLPQLAAAVVSTDPGVRGAILAAKAERLQRRRRHFEEMEAEAARRREAKRRK
jgi:hypothetical protein